MTEALLDPILTGEAPVLGVLAREGTVHAYPKRTILISEGDEGHSLYLILSGRVKVYTGDASGKELVMAYSGPGEIVGEMSLDGGLRCASVITMEPTRCAVISHAHFRERMHQDPELAMALIMLLIARSRTATRRAKEMALASVYHRVIHLLTEASEADGQGSRRVTERLSQQEIADRVGASRDMVSRIFKDLIKGGYIEVERRAIRLCKKLPENW